MGDDVDEWYRLFDALCIEQGHLDNNMLASRYCALTKKKTDTAYEAALKSLNNWRHGQHTPSRRNFRILTLLLEVEKGDSLAKWHRLYEDALRRKSAIESADGVPDSIAAGLTATRASSTGPSWRVGWITSAAVALVLFGAGGTVLGLTLLGDTAIPVPFTERPGPGPQVIDMTGLRVPWREHTVLKVGQSTVIHGARGRCGEQPPPWETAFHRLPPLSIGIWSDGGVGYRISNSCGGPTPARAIVFTATVAGDEQFYLYEDPVTIRVEE